MINTLAGYAMTQTMMTAASGETIPSMPTAFFDAEMLLSALM